MRDVVVFGERPVVDIVLDVNAIPRPGDKALVRAERVVPGGVAENTAATLGRLGVRTTYVGCGSAGALEQIALDSLRAAGVDVVTLDGLDGPGVVCYVTVGADASRTVLVRLPDDRDRIVAGYGPALAGLAPKVYGIGYLGVLSAPVIEAWDSVTSLCDRLVCAVEADVDADLASMTFPAGTVVLCAEESLSDALERLVETSGIDLVVTCGSRGGRLLRRGQAELAYDAASGDAPVVDTTGAGDAFAAGLIAGMAGGRPWEDCLDWGAQVARAAVESYGPRPVQIPPYPW
jgi:sugar/nucleoside kinase (ribokinase family)